MAYTKAQVQKMLDYINCRWAHNDLKSVNMLKDKSEYPLFKDWNMIIREKAKLMADNYKIETLKEYLHCSKLLENK